MTKYVSKKCFDLFFYVDNISYSLTEILPLSLSLSLSLYIYRQTDRQTDRDREKYTKYRNRVNLIFSWLVSRIENQSLTTLRNQLLLQFTKDSFYHPLKIRLLTKSIIKANQKFIFIEIIKVDVILNLKYKDFIISNESLFNQTNIIHNPTL